MKICIVLNKYNTIEKYGVCLTDNHIPILNGIIVETDINLKEVNIVNNYKLVNDKLVVLTEQEKENLYSLNPQPTKEEVLLKEIANLKVDNMKKDVIVTNTLKTVAELKVEIMSLKGVK